MEVETLSKRSAPWSVALGLALSFALGACAEDERPAPAPPNALGSSAALAPNAAPSGVPAPPAPSGTAETKTFACGAKGQEPCPMQKWMKAEIGIAAAEADLPKMAADLAVIAAKDPGFPEWKAISEEGVAKAKAGDLDGARMSCRKCHDKYKRIYVTTMRDRPW